MAAFYSTIRPGVYQPEHATAGPWSPEAQHAGPPSALMAREARLQVDGPLQLRSIALDILGPISLEPLTLTVTPVRPGRNVTLVSVQAVSGDSDRPCAEMRAWFTAPAPPSERLSETSLPAMHPPAALPDESPTPPIPGAYTGGYLSAVEARFIEGGFSVPGSGSAWLRPRVQLIDDEPLKPWDRTFIFADSGSGISMITDPRDISGINCDLRVSAHREPVGEWVHMASTTWVGPGEGGLTTTTLSDASGEFGVASQTLLMAAR